MVFLWIRELVITTIIHLLVWWLLFTKRYKAIASNYELIPQELIKATVISNKKRKSYLAKFLTDHPAKRIGVYKLAMKQGSDNWRESAVLEIIKKLKIAKKEILIYEPSL